MERLSKYQLGAMIVLFQIGSTPLFQLGIKAKQDSWLTVLAGLLSGLFLLLLLMEIQHREPDKNLTQIFIRYFGSVIGTIFAVMYVIFFSYESYRNVRDFGDLTVMTVLPDTPISLIMLIVMALAVYSFFQGIEVFFRVAEFVVAGVVGFYALLIVMNFTSGNVHMERLLPILENGINPILKEAVDETIWFPFGQMIVFLMFWSRLDEKKAMAKTSIRAYFVSGTVILIMNIINIAVLGPHYAAISTVPLLQTVQLIQIAEVFERFDAVIIMLFFVGIFFKAALWYLAAILGLGQLFHADYRKFILPVGAVIYAASFFPARWQTHLEVADIVAVKYRSNPIFLAAIPAFLFVVMLIRGSKRGT
ncbi:GerAB/ArcD/ProY family transporter [Paenibacillus alkalitolerans]|uniref:GerAB/ArcD/ProY family transporter n=1 Tax=Paenibacillus alkalitolerans TaxID=2799335 RepID=UPI0018F431F5|nr:GerAB/ArcD/ProY family transporter [Paenibacillus alkalitolerans]